MLDLRFSSLDLLNDDSFFFFFSFSVLVTVILEVLEMASFCHWAFPHSGVSVFSRRGDISHFLCLS